MQGNAGDFLSEESFYKFIEPALCFFTEETNYQSLPSPFGIKMADRLTGKPIHLDISDLPIKRGIITNPNKFILGPSGSGKSFFTNHKVRQYFEQGAHVLLVDTGNCYQGLCELIKGKTATYNSTSNRIPKFGLTLSSCQKFRSFSVNCNTEINGQRTLQIIFRLFQIQKQTQFCFHNLSKV